MAAGRYRLTVQTGHTSLLAIVEVEVEPADETSCLVSALRGEWVRSDWARAATRAFPMNDLPTVAQLRELVDP